MKVFSKKKAIAAIGFTICGFLSTSAPAKSSSLAAKLASAAVVKTIGPGSAGSGVLIEIAKANGTGTMPVIVTAGHVLKGTGKTETIEIRLYDDTLIEVNGSNIIFLDDVDLAFVKVEARILHSNRHTYAKVGNPNILNHGDYVVVSGYPLESEGNVSNRVRISEGSLQTFSSADANKSLVGYSANTFPGMSGGGVFNDKGELVYIHLKGEKDMYKGNLNESSKVLKSGTNYGISVLHAINRLRELETAASKPIDPLERYQRGLFYVQSNKPDYAYKIFAQLHKEFPDSLVAEWSAKCMLAQVQHPYGQPTIWPEGELAQEAFFKKYGVNPVYSWPYFTDSAIWKEKERRVLLSYDPIYKLAKPISDLSYSNRGALVGVRRSGHCEYLPGLRTYNNRNNEEIVYWEMIPNPSQFARNRDFETDPKTFRQILIRPK